MAPPSGAIFGERPTPNNLIDSHTAVKYYCPHCDNPVACSYEQSPRRHYRFVFSRNAGDFGGVLNCSCRKGRGWFCKPLVFIARRRIQRQYFLREEKRIRFHNFHKPNFKSTLRSSRANDSHFQRRPHYRWADLRATL